VIVNVIISTTKMSVSSYFSTKRRVVNCLSYL